jgi:hypothetical protein
VIVVLAAVGMEFGEVGMERGKEEGRKGGGDTL